jgi:putative DNA primase/helicase
MKKVTHSGLVVGGTPKAKAKTKTKAKSQAPAPPPRILDRSNPMASARALLADYFVQGGLQTLWRHREEFWIWNGSYYQLASGEMLRTHIWKFLERSSRVDPKTKDVVPFKPTPSSVSAVADALGAVCNLSEHIEPPVWLMPDPNKPVPVELLACANGLLHLPSGKLYPASADFFCVSASKIKYDRKAKAPRWNKFLRTLYAKDRQPVRLLQHWFGYTISPDLSQQKILGLIGPPRSGKGTIARLLTELLGTTSVAGPTMHSLGETFGLEPLITKPLAIISDVRIGRNTSVSTIVERTLSISGEDVMTVPRKHNKAWHGRLPTRVMFMTNEPLALTDSSGAFTSRLMMLKLTVSFLGREDIKLTNKLKKELPGILNWAIAGYRSLTAAGHFTQPKSSLAAVDHMERLASPVKAFVSDYCVVEDGASVPIDELYKRWTECCDEEGRKDSGTKEWFSRNLHAVVPKLVTKRPRGTDPNRPRCYFGIALIPLTETEKTINRLIHGNNAAE